MRPFANFSGHLLPLEVDHCQHAWCLHRVRSVDLLASTTSVTVLRGHLTRGLRTEGQRTNGKRTKRSNGQRETDKFDILARVYSVSLMTKLFF